MEWNAIRCNAASIIHTRTDTDIGTLALTLVLALARTLAPFIALCSGHATIQCHVMSWMRAMSSVCLPLVHQGRGGCMSMDNYQPTPLLATLITRIDL